VKCTASQTTPQTGRLQAVCTLSDVVLRWAFGQLSFLRISAHSGSESLLASGWRRAASTYISRLVFFFQLLNNSMTSLAASIPDGSMSAAASAQAGAGQSTAAEPAESAGSLVLRMQDPLRNEVLSAGPDHRQEKTRSASSQSQRRYQHSSVNPL
jgi:hypothetical protein